MALIALAAIAALSVGYLAYGRWIARKFVLDDSRVTPAVAVRDGVDFVPTRRFYLMGQHFSAIAAAGPIAGPILACLAFGWLPCLLWIVVGVVLIGAVHDLASLVASIRHRAASVAEILRDHVGRPAWLAMLAFVWLALLYVLVAFADITANTFVGRAEELAGAGTFHPGGAVAAASTMYLGLAVVMGLVQRRFDPPLWLLTVVFVPATLGVIWLGTRVSGAMVLDQRSWSMAILGYCFVASLLPVWLLLQPRGYLGGFVLYLALAVGLVGALFGGLPIAQPMFRGWTAPGPTGSMFPFLFVTIACGACSGFHGLVCSGTTSKQILHESDCRPVGYGTMLLEAFVAVISLATVLFVAPSEVAGRGPGRLYGDGLGRFLTVIVGEEHLTFARTFGAMAFSTFVFDTLDVATRLGRYLVQEAFALRGWIARLLATGATVALPLLILATAATTPGAPPPYMSFWVLFGTANQLLAALTLMAVALWLHREGKKAWFLTLPMAFLMAVTVSSLLRHVQAALAAASAQGAGLDSVTVNGAVAAVLLALAVYLTTAAWRAVRRPGAPAPVPTGVARG
jgi:carbon starvation protein